MVSWEEFARAAPEMAAFGLERLYAHEDTDTYEGGAIGFIATVRHDDGGPRLHPLVPILLDGHLYVSIGKDSPKVADLRRDPRYMLHAFPDAEDPEFSVRGEATEIDDPELRARVFEAAGFDSYDERDPIFELSVERADSTVWLNWGTTDLTPVRRRWTT